MFLHEAQQVRWRIVSFHTSNNTKDPSPLFNLKIPPPLLPSPSSIAKSPPPHPVFGSVTTTTIITAAAFISYLSLASPARLNRRHQVMYHQHRDQRPRSHWLPMGGAAGQRARKSCWFRRPLLLLLLGGLVNRRACVKRARTKVVEVCALGRFGLRAGHLPHEDSNKVTLKIL